MRDRSARPTIGHASGEADPTYTIATGVSPDSMPVIAAGQGCSWIMARGRDKPPQGISSVWAITWPMKPFTSVDIIRGHYIQAPHHRPACRPLWSRCLGEVYRNGTRWARQCKCLNRVVWRVLRGSQAQVSRRTRQERISSARVRRARFNPDHDGPMCRPQLDPNLHDLGSRG
jgi:hypothetical protein